MWLGGAEGEPPLELLQLKAEQPEQHELMATVAAWQAGVDQSLASAFLCRSDELSLIDSRITLSAIVDGWQLIVGGIPYDNYMSRIFEELSATDILSDPVSSSIRGLPFGSPISDWL